MIDNTLEKRHFPYKDLLFLSGIFLLGFFLRLVYIYQYKDSPFFSSPVIDALSHYKYALRMAKGDWLVKGVVAPRAPLYVYFLALIFKFFGTGFTAARIVQAFLGSINCILVYFLGKRVFSPLVGMVAAFICSVYGVFIYFDAEFLTVGLTIFLELLLLLMFLHTAEKPRAWKWFCCGLLFGISLQTSPNVILFFPLMLIWAYLFSDDKGFKSSKRLKSVIFVFFGAALTVLPLSLRNYFQGGEFVLIATSSGINLYIGNNPQADGKSAHPPSRDFSYSGWEDNVLISSTKAAEREAGRKMKASEVSSFWVKKTRDFIFKAPGKFLGLLIRKFYYFFNAYEIPENQSIYFFRIWSSLLQVLVFANSFISFPFGIICPLALLGMAVSFRKEKSIILLFLFILAHFLLMMIFFVVSRYRTPIIPYFVIFSVYGGLWFLKNPKNMKLKSKTVLICLFMFLFFFCNSKLFGVADEDTSRWFFNLGTAFRYKGENEKARKSFAQALKLSLNDPDIRYNLGVFDLETGKYDDAIKNFLLSIERDPLDSAAYANAGVALMKKGNTDEALIYFKKALEIDPMDIGAMINISAAYLENNLLNDSQNWLEKAKALDNNFAPVYNQLGIIYEKTGNNALAESAYLKAIELKKDYFQAYYNLGTFYENNGNPEKAKSMRAQAMTLLHLEQGRTE
ncbi:MAG: tetratricopeptide repeat protein [Candidatus Omnitrophica bacterium]|nr:tetratricopeptide repeat protein [Candidatus Omnitrophota bacterium]